MKPKHKAYGFYEAYIKRILDCILATLMLIILSPLLLGIAIIIRIKLGKPILFIQNRPGKNERIFKLYKFRSMSNTKDSNGHLLPDKDRLTKFGKRLRSSSLDELPELINVIKGDMAIIGPRPLAVQYLPYYTEEEQQRHDVRPGLSGLAQVNGRNALQWEERFKYDVEYVNKITFLGDLNIIFKTIGKVIKKENIEAHGEGILIDFDIYRKNKELGDFK